MKLCKIQWVLKEPPKVWRIPIQNNLLQYISHRPCIHPLNDSKNVNLSKLIIMFDSVVTSRSSFVSNCLLKVVGGDRCFIFGEACCLLTISDLELLLPLETSVRFRSGLLHRSYTAVWSDAFFVFMLLVLVWEFFNYLTPKADTGVLPA